MSGDLANRPVTMVRYHLHDIPLTEVPLGYRLRWYRPGDRAHWLAVHTLSEEYLRIDESLFDTEFGSDETLLGERQCFLLTDDDMPVGTISAWFSERSGEMWGRIHWLAVVPEHRGRGLSKPLLSAACSRLRELGHHKAFLDSSTARTPALALYRSFGFVPDILNDEDAAAWRQVDRIRVDRPR